MCNYYKILWSVRWCNYYKILWSVRWCNYYKILWSVRWCNYYKILLSVRWCNYYKILWFPFIWFPFRALFYNTSACTCSFVIGCFKAISTLSVALSSPVRVSISDSPDKCEFGHPEFSFLGHHASASGSRPLPEQVQAERDFPQLKTTSDLMCYLGLIYYYHHFFPSALNSSIRSTWPETKWYHHLDSWN